MRRISTAKRAGGRARPPVRRSALSAAAVIRVTSHVLKAERSSAAVSVTFLSRPAIRKLNREWLGHDWATDVVTFALPAPDGSLTGDVYICPAVAKLEAKAHGVTQREELLRLVVHGTLHVLGYTHPEGATRTRSAMWRRQERYVKALV